MAEHDALLLHQNVHADGDAPVSGAQHGNAGQAQQRFHREIAEAREIARLHMQQEIHVARHRIAGHHFGPGTDRRLEGLAVLGEHVIGAAHGADRCGDDRAAGVNDGGAAAGQ